MRLRTALVIAGFFAFMPALAIARKSTAQEPARTAAPAVAANAVSPDRAAIQAAAKAFVDGYNAGDAPALAKLFAEDAESVDADGSVVEGRAAIAAQFSELFASDPGGKIQLETDSVRFLGPTVAKEEGRSSVTSGAGGPPVKDRYTVIYHKQNGQWLQTYVREYEEKEITPHEHLKALEWMVGHWVSENHDALIVSDCQWSPDKNFLVRTYTIQVAGKLAMTGTQRMGWDPTSGQVKSWVFDSTGGHSEGLWSHDGNRWVSKLSGPFRNGKIFSETSVFTVVSKDRVRWKLVDRTVGAELAPDVGEFMIVRKPPPPQAD